MSVIAYRADIDGLRAVAVGTVVLFHAGLGLFPGGFIGVDVFFVISAYLITSIIARELDTGTFSLVSFYERRIRRIFPALLVMIAVCLAVGYWRMTPVDYDLLGESAVAAIGFHSNFYFAESAGYFMPAAETLPLLHTWSLGVEEQFYVVAPLLLMVFWRIKAWLVPAIALLFAIALAASILGLAYDSDRAFYWPHTRAVELMIGMILGLGLVPAIRSSRMRGALSAVGLATILLSASFYGSDTAFPGAAALVPCIGAALIIHCAGGVHGTSLVGGLLSTPPVVWLGKISYSLYLWHWPIFAFAIYEWGAIGPASRVALVAIAIGLSAASYYWIEQPARRSRIFVSRQKVFAASIGAAGAIAGVAIAVDVTDGLPGRLTTKAAAFAATASIDGTADQRCDKASGQDFWTKCLVGVPGARTEIVVWGDSHALALTRQIDAVAKELGVAAMMVLRGGCPPLLDAGTRSGAGKAKCRIQVRRLNDVLAKGTIRHIVIASRWSLYTGRQLKDFRETSHLESPTEIETQFAAAFAHTLARFREANYRVTLIGPVPELPMHLPSAMMKAQMRSRDFTMAYDPGMFAKREKPILDALAMAEKTPATDVIYPERILCPIRKCRFIVNDLPLYRDNNHLNTFGADLLKPSLVLSLSWLKKTTASNAGLATGSSAKR